MQTDRQMDGQSADLGLHCLSNNKGYNAVFCYLCFVFFMLSYLFISALWSPAARGLTSYLSCV